MLQIGMRSGEAGFTLLEVLIVLCLAGIMSAGIALSFGSALTRSTRDRFAAELQGSLTRAAELARRTGRDQRVDVREGAGGVVIMVNGRSLLAEAPIAVGWVSAREAAASEQAAAIVFFGAGGSSGGALNVSDGQSVVTIRVDWLTAKVSLAEKEP